MCMSTENHSSRWLAGRSAISTSIVYESLIYFGPQILESTYNQPIFSAEDGNEDWAAFVAAIPECASTANSSETFSCLRQVDTTSIVNALGAGVRFQPVLDGSNGLIPDWPSQLPILSDIPLLLGTNLDEGLQFLLHHSFNSTLIPLFRYHYRSSQSQLKRCNPFFHHLRKHA